MRQARALQQSEAFSEYRQRRVVVEHRLARLVQLGIRQSRYFGRAKTKFQLYLAATVANLTLVAAKAGLPAGAGGGSSICRSLRTETIRSAFDFVPARLCQILTMALLALASLPTIHLHGQGFPARFLGLIRGEAEQRGRIKRSPLKATNLDVPGKRGLFDKWQEPATVQDHLADWMRLNPRGSELPMGEVVSLFTGPFLNSHCSIENCFNKDSVGPYMHNIANDTRWTVHHHE